MTTAYTPLLGFALPVEGELDGAWGDVVNQSITELVEDSIAATATQSVTAGDWTLTTTGSGSVNQARCAILVPTGTPGVTRNIIAPSSSKAYIIDNKSDAAVVVKAAATTGTSIPAGTQALVAWTGTDFVSIGNNTPAGVTSVSGTGTVNGITLSGTVTSTGSLTLGGALTGVDLTSQVTGTLPLANGGTNATTAAGARTSLDVPSTTGSGASGTWGINVTGNAGTVTNGVYTTGSYADPAWITSLAGSKVSGNISGNAANVTGTVAIANGGTGATTQQAALNAIAGATTSAQFLRGNGVNVQMSAIQVADVPTLNQNTTGTAANVTGVVAIANGGTGATTDSAARTALSVPSNTGSGASGTWGISVTGNAGTVTNGVVTTGSYNDPTWITGLAGSKISGNISGNAGNVTGVVAVANGGTGLSATPTNGQLDIGNGTGFTRTTLSAGSGISITNGSGSITIAATGSSGTVTSVGLSAPTGFSVSNSPITGAGTIALSFASGYSLPTNASQAAWDDAYTDRLKWDGGSTGLVASTGRTSLGATTVGSNFFTLANPSAVTFTRVNADNSVSLLGASDFRTAIGAGTGSGTVTSVGLSMPSGFSVSNSPVTGSGTLTVTTTLSGVLKGTGSGITPAVAGTDYITPTGTETLSNKTLTKPTINEGYAEQITALGTNLLSTLTLVSRGSIQTITLSGNSSPTDGLLDGQSLTLMVDDGTAYSITWPSVTWKTGTGTAPYLNTSGYTVIQLWKVSGVLYGARVGDA
jgi:hypothetical protein